MGVWPRKRAAKETPRVRAWASSKDKKLLGFAGYKVGMTQIQYTDAKKTSITKGMDVTVPVTIIECPPLKVFGARAYKKSYYGTTIVGQILKSSDKSLEKRMIAPKEISTFDAVNADSTDEIVLLCHTQPGLTGIGKKTPEVFEVGIGGSLADQIEFAKEMVGKDVAVSDLFASGDFVDAHGVTTGKGYQGVIKRFGVGLKQKKSEKGQRRVGARSGGWTSQRHMMYRVAQPGQLGYHKRVDYNKQIMF
ncbi:MAG: 50S ribosomal protein L3, partial [bacterium]